MEEFAENLHYIAIYDKIDKESPVRRQDILYNGKSILGRL